MLDASGSIGTDNFAIFINFVESVVQGLDMENGQFRVGLLLFR